MYSLARAALFSIFVVASVRAAPNQFVARYVSIGTGGVTDLLAVDASGNFFVVGTVTEPSGRPQIRATKTDSQGNFIASIDFGGSSETNPDVPSGAAVDLQGNLVIVGATDSQDFPLVSPLRPNTTLPAAFIVKLDSQLTKIMFSTLLGTGQASAVALDTAGNIYVAGSTGASDFPTTPGAFQITGPTSYYNMGFPVFAFVTEISPNGSSILFSTYFGSNSTECTGDSFCQGKVGSTSANAIALDSSGDIFIGGTTTANQLPVTPGTLGQQCGCGYSAPENFVQSSFLAKFAPGGQQLIWATYIPLAQTSVGENTISITTLVMDAQGNVIFGGSASSGLFVTPGALQSSYTAANAPDYGADFIAKVDASAKSYLFSTYFGKGVFDSQSTVTSLALDSQGDIWLTGGSDPAALPFPASTPLLGSTYVAELSADGSSVLSGITAPAGAAGQAIVTAPSGSPAALGSAGSLLLSLPNQPASLVGIENSAGIQVSSYLAPYELVSLYGVGLGPANAIGGQVVSGALTTSLGGIQVLFNNVAAPLLYVGPNQINAIVPSGVFGQDTASVQVITPNGILTGPALSVVPSEPEVFQNSAPMPQGGSAIALNQDGSLNSGSNPAANESIVTIWATGAGESPGDLPAGYVATGFWTPKLPVSVLDIRSETGGSGTDSVAVLYAGDSPGMVTGVLQVNFQLPPQGILAASQFTFQLQVGAALSGRFTIFVQP